MELVVCNNACGDCRHGQPHKKMQHGNKSCTQWGTCLRSNGASVKVRCVNFVGNDSGDNGVAGAASVWAAATGDRDEARVANAANEPRSDSK
jgi:hypothetical protein